MVVLKSPAIQVCYRLHGTMTQIWRKPTVADLFGNVCHHHSEVWRKDRLGSHENEQTLGSFNNTKHQDPNISFLSKVPCSS